MRALLETLAPRECWPTKSEALACAGVYACMAFLAWATCLPHSWNS